MGAQMSLVEGVNISFGGTYGLMCRAYSEKCSCAFCGV